MKILTVSSSTLQFVLEMWAQWVSGLQLLIKEYLWPINYLLKENIIITSNKSMWGITQWVSLGLKYIVFCQSILSFLCPSPSPKPHYNLHFIWYVILLISFGFGIFVSYAKFYKMSNVSLKVPFWLSLCLFCICLFKFLNE